MFNTLEGWELPATFNAISCRLQIVDVPCQIVLLVKSALTSIRVDFELQC